MGNFNKNLQDSVRGILYVIKRPAWLAISLLMALLISTLIYFSVNIGFYGPLFLTLSFFDSLSAIGIMTVAMVQSYFADLNGVLLLVVSLLQGVAIAIFIFTSRKNKKMDVSVVGRSGFALIFATLGWRS